MKDIVIKQRGPPSTTSPCFNLTCSFIEPFPEYMQLNHDCDIPNIRFSSPKKYHSRLPTAHPWNPDAPLSDSNSPLASKPSAKYPYALSRIHSVPISQPPRKRVASAGGAGSDTEKGARRDCRDGRLHRSRDIREFVEIGGF